jgi:hypothetical protein
MTENLMMLDEKEPFWKQRAHDNWLFQGDGNNDYDYFHRIANGRKRKNNIIFLEEGNKKIFGDENILLHATKYYLELFGLAPGNMFQVDKEVWDGLGQLNELDNNVLCDNFSEKEIKEALFQMEKIKLLVLTAFLLSSIKSVGTLLKKILSISFMIFMLDIWMLLELIMASSLCFLRVKRLPKFSNTDPFAF